MRGILSTTNYKTFVVLSNENDTTIPIESADSLVKAMPGDTVEYQPTMNKWTVAERCKQPPIVGVLELSSKTKYGMTSRGIPIYLFIPCNKKYPMMFVGCSHRDTKQNQLALVNFHEWETTTFPRGNLIRLLGPCGDTKAEHEAIFLTYNPYKELKVPALGTEIESQPFREETPYPTFNIDPPGCKDIDDVLSLRVNTESNTVELWITIADVSAHIADNSDLDRYALQQGATAYSDGNAVRPMLPRVYSEDNCSLHVGQPRLGVSLVLTYSLTNLTEALESRWYLSSVVNSYQFEYDSCVDEATKHAIPISILQQIASGILGKDTHDTHKWVEACMLKYNLSAAEILRKQETGILRKHQHADLEKLQLYESWGGSALSVLANKAAQYCKANDESPHHWGLEAPVYCHATSPIRRYADLVNQRVLKAYILGTETQTRVYQSDIQWLNDRQKALKSFERDLFLNTKLLESASTTVKALVIDAKPAKDILDATKYTLWLPDWKRVMTWKTSSEIPDTVCPSTWISLQWFSNPAKRRWKDAIVFRFESIAG